VIVATLSFLTYSHFILFIYFFFLLHLKKLVAGQKFHEDKELKNDVTMRLLRRRRMMSDYKNSYPG